jgi:hypothetical protein
LKVHRYRYGGRWHRAENVIAQMIFEMRSVAAEAEHAA